MRRIEILEEAATEAIEAASRYDRERIGLGSEFERALEAAFDLLEEEIVPLVPVTRASRARGVKRLLLKRFPYEVVVRETPQQVIVIAIAHQSRRPGYWRSRVKGG